MSNPTLNRNELFNEVSQGYHVAESPIKGYRKLACYCPIIPVFDAVAEIEIPTGSKIIKPSSGGKFVYQQMEASQMKVNDIKNMNGKSVHSECECELPWNRNFVFPNPKSPTNKINSTYRGNLYYYLTFENAWKSSI